MEGWVCGRGGVRRLTLLLGMVLQDALMFLVQCGTLVAVALIMGLRPYWTGMFLRERCTLVVQGNLPQAANESGGCRQGT